MSSGDYVLGVLGLAAVTVSLALAGRSLRRVLVPGWSGAPALLADAVLAIALLVAVGELLGLAGVLTGVTLVLGSLAALGLCAGLTRGRASDGTTMREAPPVSGIELGIAVALSLLVVAQWAGPTLLALDRGIYGGDSLWYHLPFAADIAGTGSVTHLLFTDPLYLNWFYPENSELIHAGGILLFGNDFLSPLLNLGWLALALLAGWCIGRPYRAAAPTTAAVAALMAADLMFSRQPGNANNDVAAIALCLASIALLVNLRTEAFERRALALLPAALAAGLALGTKLTVVVLVLALAVGVVAITQQGMRLRIAGVWAAGLFGGAGLWFTRNVVVSGNPFPWVDAGPLSKPEELQGRPEFSIAHYLTDTDVWGNYFRPGLEERLGDLWPLVLLVAVAGVAVWLLRGTRLERMLAAVAVVAAVGYVLTPLGASGQEGFPVGFRLNIRYLAPGLALALVLAAIPPRLGREREAWWRWSALGLFALLLFVSDGVLGSLDGDRLAGVVAVTAIAAVPAALYVLLRRGAPRLALAGAALAAFCVIAVAGRAAQSDYLELRYSTAAPDYPRGAEHPATELDQGLGAASDWARETGGERIGLSGTTGSLFQYGLWGGDSSNRVRYVGVRGDRGSFYEPSGCEQWATAVNSGDYDYVVTTPVYDQDDPESAAAPEQRDWIASDPRVRRVAGAGLVDVWKLDGPLDPALCPLP
ncbi:MAG: hypothetical protein EXQ70_08615 [Solirubrobacterales bacterium]|nr:hypothetical protein [Solirubrobacterales bacterium]